MWSVLDQNPSVHKFFGGFFHKHISETNIYPLIKNMLSVLLIINNT